MSRMSGFDHIEALRAPSYQKIISPERLLFENDQNQQIFKYSKSADVYGYSFILWEMLQKRPLDEAYFLPPSGIHTTINFNSSGILKLDGKGIYCGKKLSRFFYHVKQGYRPWLPQNRLSPITDYISLISMCWMSNPEDRPTFQEISSFLSPLKEFQFQESIPPQRDNSMDYLNDDDNEEYQTTAEPYRE